MSEEASYGKWVPILSLVVAAIGIISGVYLNKLDRELAVEIKKYEVTFIEKQKAYSKFIEAISNIYFHNLDASQNMEYAELMGELEYSFYLLEPFLPADYRNQAWVKLQEYIAFASNSRSFKSETEANESGVKFAIYRFQLRQTIFNGLFGSEPATNRTYQPTH